MRASCQMTVPWSSMPSVCCSTARLKWKQTVSWSEFGNSCKHLNPSSAERSRSRMETELAAESHETQRSQGSLDLTWFTWPDLLTTKCFQGYHRHKILSYCYPECHGMVLHYHSKNKTRCFKEPGVGDAKWEQWNLREISRYNLQVKTLVFNRSTCLALEFVENGVHLKQFTFKLSVVFSEWQSKWRRNATMSSICWWRMCKKQTANKEQTQ